MAVRHFELNQPHEITVGDALFKIQPEVSGAEFAEAYGALKEVQAKVTGSRGNSSKAGKAADASPKALAELSQAMRTFIGGFVLDDYRQTFDETMIPDRILTGIIEFIGQVYGGGQGNDRGGLSTDS